MRTRRTSAAGVLLALVCGLASTLAAQNPHPLRVGDRVRLSVVPVAGPTAEASGPKRLVGSLMRLTADSAAVYDDERAETVAVALDAVRGIEISHGRHGHGGRGALIGLAAGLAGGVASESSGGDYKGLAVGALGLGGALVGTGVGALVGSLIRSERWGPARLP